VDRHACQFFCLLLLLPIMPAAAQQGTRISPRLLTEAGKSLDGDGLRPVVLWPAAGHRLALPASAAGRTQIREDDTVLVRLSLAEIITLSDDDAIAYAAPQEQIVPPTDIDEPLPPDDGGIGKALRVLPGNDGAGVRIGIIDFGSIPPGAAARANLVAETRLGREPSPHMALVAQIVSQFAPDAELYTVSLSPGRSNTQDIITAARWLAEQNVRIINFSGVSYQGRRDGRAPLDRFVDTLARRGILWVSAAGNEAQRSWSGASVDRDDNGLVDVAGSDSRDAITLTATGGPVQVAITWDDWGSVLGVPAGLWRVGATLVDDAGKAIATARSGRFLGIGEPVASLDLTQLPAGRYRLQLTAAGGTTPVQIHVAATGAVARLSPAVAATSIGNPGTAAAALTVSAVAAPGFATTAYSGRGPTLDGRAKPEIAALGYAEGRNRGTSYAVPRITALAARILGENPSLTVAALKARVLGASVPVNGRRSAGGEAPLWLDSRPAETTGN
jgi:hypothetical protein